jgi:molybdate transport system substrate-binding protein
MKQIFLPIILLLSLSSCDEEKRGREINIAVAANVGYAIGELKKEFNKLHPDIDIHITVGSSGKLTAQIKNNAPYHLFISADMNYPATLYKKGVAVTRPVIYARGGLALLSLRERNFSEGLEILKSEKIDKIAIANPKTAPYGKASFEALDNIGMLKEIKEKFIYGESISQTLSYTANADIGLIAKSALYTPQMKHLKKGANWIEIDQRFYTPIDQGVVILKDGANSEDAKAFYNFLLGARGRQLLKSFGYSIP